MKLLVFFLTFLFGVYPGVAGAAGAAAINLAANKQTLGVGEQVVVDVYVSSAGQAFNAVSGSVVYPTNSLRFVSITREGSVIDFWTEEPHSISNKIRFEGIVLNPGYQGAHGSIFKVVFEARTKSTGRIYLSDGAVLANDGLGSNIAGSLGSTTLAIADAPSGPFATTDTVQSPAALARALALPVITDYSRMVDAKGISYVKGKGEPNALTKIVFKNVSLKSIGEKFIDFVQAKKSSLDEVLVRNDASGAFEYTSGNNLIAGAYNATPFLVDDATNTERPGLGVQLLVKDSRLVHILVIAINVLALLVPVVGLIVLIYFIPWYSLRRMHLLKRRLGFEEEKIQLSEHKLKNIEKTLDKDIES